MTSGGGHPLSLYPRYLIFAFSRGKVLQEEVLIINLDAFPSELSNIFLVCSLANILACVLILYSCFLVILGFKITRMSACGCNQFVFERLCGVLVYPDFFFTDVELDPVVDLGDAKFVRNLILP